VLEEGASEDAEGDGEWRAVPVARERGTLVVRVADPVSACAGGNAWA
jgi:hypothetical protein